MQEKNNKFQDVISNITKIGMYAVAAIILLIGILSIFITANLNTTFNFAGEKTTFDFSFGIVNILISLGLLILFSITTRILFKRIPAKYLMIPLSIACLILFVYWVNAIQLSPEADQRKIHEVAKTFFDSGDIYHHLQPTQYIHHFPYQCGIAYMFSLVYKLFGETNYFYIQYLNTILSIINMILLFVISKIIFDDEKVQKMLVFLLAGFSLFWMFFNVHVYGNILGLTFALIAMIFTLLFIKKENALYIVFSGVFMALSILAKSNYNIFLCGIVLLLVLHIIKKWNLKIVLIIPLITLSILAVNTTYNTIMKEKYDVKFSKGVPMITYVYMGMQETEGTPGWYTNIVLDLYAKHMFETEPTAEDAKELLYERLAYFADNPGEFISYFAQKIGSTWLNPTFQTVWCSLPGPRFEWYPDYAHYLAYHETAVSMVGGKLYDIELIYFDSYQTLIFIFAGIGVLLSIKDKDLNKTLIPIIFIGGFLFHIIWETKAIYVIQYYFLLLPYAAKGLVYFIDKSILKYKDLKYKKLNEKN